MESALTARLSGLLIGLIDGPHTGFSSERYHFLESFRGRAEGEVKSRSKARQQGLGRIEAGQQAIEPHDEVDDPFH